jgi:ADP-heptose:LPS heptosyltransferase
MRILAINFGGIGDEILFSPTLESIRSVYPGAHLTLLLEPRSKSFEQITDTIDEIITFDIKKKPLLPKDLIDLLQLIRKGKYDVVLSSGSSPSVAALLFLTGIKVKIGYSSNRLASALLSNPIPLNREQYAAAMYQDLSVGLGAKKLTASQCLPKAVLQEASISSMKRFLEPSVTLGTADNRAASARTEQKSLQKILIHPGTSRLAVTKGIIKTWPASRWITLVNRLQESEERLVILAGGPDDHAIVQEILDKVERTPQLLSASGITKNLADLAALIFLSDLLICVDSAPMHLAVALNKPLLALFGPTDERKLLPQSKIFRSLRDKPISEFPRRLGDGLGVLLQPDTVYLSVLDQLKELTIQENSQERFH